MLINFEITLKWEDYSRLSGSANVMTRVLKYGERKLKRQRGYDGKNEVGTMDGEDSPSRWRGHKPRNADSL